MLKRFFWGFSSLLLLTSCSYDLLDVDVEDIQREVSIERFEEAFFTSDSIHFDAALNRLKAGFPLFFNSGGTDRFWKYQRTDARQLELFAETQKVFRDLEPIRKDLRNAMKHFYYYYPEHAAIDFYTYISNLDFEYPVLYTEEEEACFIALDLYLGADRTYYQHLPAYLAFERQPYFLVRDCLEAIGRSKIPVKEQLNPSLLDAMIYHGKLLYFIEAMMPAKPKHLIIQYTPEQTAFCRDNERNIWSYFIENQLLFSKKDDDLKRFIEPAPFSKFRMKFDNQTPGRIGQWVGWQIVQSYHNENPEISLPELMAMGDAQRFLRQSGYKP